MVGAPAQGDPHDNHHGEYPEAFHHRPLPCPFAGVRGRKVPGTSRRDPPRSVPPPTVLTDVHPCPGARLAPQVERREVLEDRANNSGRGVSCGHFGDPTDGCPRAVLRCVPEPARFARELGEALRPVRGARPTGRRSAVRGSPMEGRGLGPADRPAPRPGAWAGPPADPAPRHRCLGRTGSVPSGWRWSSHGTTYDERVLMYKPGALSDLVHKKRVIPSGGYYASL